MITFKFVIKERENYDEKVIDLWRAPRGNKGELGKIEALTRKL